MDIVATVAKDHGQAMPAAPTPTVASFANMTPADAKALAAALWAAGNLAAITALRDQCDVMVKTVQNSAITSKAG